MKIKRLPPISYLLQCFSLDAKQGRLFWLCRPSDHFETMRSANSWNRRFSGKECGRIAKDGRRIVFLDYKAFYVSRIIFALHNGFDPRERIDHENMDPLNNRPENLRIATAQQNLWNSGPRKNNILGVKGVRRERSGKYRAQIRHEGKSVNLGTFSTITEASDAFKNAVKKLRGEFLGVAK